MMRIKFWSGGSWAGGRGIGGLMVVLLLSLGLAGCGDSPSTPTAVPVAQVAAQPSVVAGGTSATGAASTEIAAVGCLPAYSPVSGKDRVVQLCVSDEAPKQDADVTLFGRLILGGKLVTGEKMEAHWDFKFLPWDCKAVADSVTGVASCTRNVGNATKNFMVNIQVKFTQQDQEYSGITAFTTDGVKGKATTTVAGTVATNSDKTVEATTVAAPAVVTTVIAPTATVVPATATAAPPTATSVPPTSTPITATATPVPLTATPKAAPTVAPVPASDKGLGLTKSVVQKVFEAKPYSFKFENVPPANGQSRVMGYSKDKQSQLELIGPFENLSSATLIFGISATDKVAAAQQGIYISIFLNTVAPDWVEGPQWIQDNLLKAISDTSVKTSYGKYDINMLGIGASDGALFTLAIEGRGK
jgi:hypothetical protein